jgi:TonB family protein
MRTGAVLTMHGSIKQRLLIGAAIVSIFPVLSGQSRSHRSSQPAAERGGAATLVLSCDLACDLQLDGEDTKGLLADATTRVRVSAGDHVIVAISSSDGKDKLEKEFEVRGGATATIQIKLRPVRLARLTRELQETEQNIDRFKKESEASAAGSQNSVVVPSPAPAPLGQENTPEPSAPLEISSVVAQDMLISKTAPEYPPVARASGVSGTVTLHGTITTEGAVEDLTVVKGPELLRQAALDAVKNWKYKPYLVNNRPFPVTTTFQITFTLVTPSPPTLK